MKRIYAMLLMVALTAVGLFAVNGMRPEKPDEPVPYEPVICADGMFYHQTGHWERTLPTGWKECGTIAKKFARTEELPVEQLVSNCCAEGLRVFSFRDDEGQRKQGIYVELHRECYRYYDLIDPETGEYDAEPPQVPYTEVWLEGMTQFYGVDTHFTYTPADPAESVESVALHMVEQYLQALNGMESPRLFEVYEYRNLTVDVFTSAEASTFGAADKAEVSETMWLVSIRTLECMGEGFVSPIGELPDGGWWQPPGLRYFQLEKQGDTYTFFSRSAPGEISKFVYRVYG